MAQFDAHSNFDYSTVATAPSPATSGTSLVVAAGTGSLFPAVPFNLVVWPAGMQPLATNAEIVRVTVVSTDTFTIVRNTTTENNNTFNRTVVVGDQVAVPISYKMITDIEAALNSTSVPQNPTAGYTVAANTQVMFFTNIDMTAANGDLIINGILQGVH